EDAAKTLGYKKIAVVSLDYAFGWEIVGGFQQTFEDNGGRVIQKIWVPLNVQDYAPYLTQIRKDADAVFVLALGRWTLLFAKQWAVSGLAGKLPLIAGGTYSDEHVLPELGDESIGVISAHHYSAALDTPANRRFRAALREKDHPPPLVLLGELLHGGARGSRGGQSRQRSRGGPGRLHGCPPRGGDQRRPSRAGEDGYLRQSHPEHLHPEGRAGERQAAEPGDLYVSRGEPVLEV